MKVISQLFGQQYQGAQPPAPCASRQELRPAPPIANVASAAVLRATGMHYWQRWGSHQTSLVTHDACPHQTTRLADDVMMNPFS